MVTISRRIVSSTSTSYGDTLDLFLGPSWGVVLFSYSFHYMWGCFMELFPLSEFLLKLPASSLYRGNFSFPLASSLIWAHVDPWTLLFPSLLLASRCSGPIQGWYRAQVLLLTDPCLPVGSHPTSDTMVDVVNW